MQTANRLLLALITLVFAASVQARNALVVNHEKIAVKTSSGKPLDAESVKKTIMIAGTSKGWSMSDAPGGGKLRATLTVRTHTITVEIEYSAAEFSIRYADSVNMNYKDGTIHPNYNRWVENMLAAIRAELSKL